MRTRLTVPLLALLVTASAAAGAQEAPADAAEAPGILPLTFALTENAAGHAAQVAWVVENAVRQSARHRFLDPVEKFDPEGVRTRRERANLGTAELEFGRKAYRNLESGMGASAFDRALSAFEDGPLWESFPSLVEALTMRILVRWQDDPSAARRQINALLAIAPQAQFPAALTPPDLRAEVERARDALVAETRFSLDVNAEPVDARVYIDGEYRGTTPLSIRGLPGGEHYLSVVAPGYDIHQSTVRVAPGATTTVSLKVADRARPFLTFIDRVKEGFGEAEEVTAARTLGRVAGADQMLVAGLTRRTGKIHLELHRMAVADGHVFSVTSVEIPENARDFDDQVRAAVMELLEKDRARGRNGEPAPLRSRMNVFLGKVTSVDERTVTIGTGVASGMLLLAGGTLGLVAYGQNTTFRNMQHSAQVPDRAASGFRTALAADILVGAGLATAATWARMQFGRKHARKTDIEAPPVLERSRRDDDPFAALERRDLEAAPLAEVSEAEGRLAGTVPHLVHDLPGPDAPQKRSKMSPYAGLSRGAVLFGVKGAF